LHGAGRGGGEAGRQSARIQSDIWSFPVPGSPQQNTKDALRITLQTGQAQTPSVSPDGKEFVYLSDSGGHGNLWVASSVAKDSQGSYRGGSTHAD